MFGVVLKLCLKPEVRRTGGHCIAVFEAVKGFPKHMKRTEITIETETPRAKIGLKEVFKLIAMNRQ